MICIADIKPLGYSHAGTFYGKPQTGSHRTRLGTGTEAKIRDGGMFSFCPKESCTKGHQGLTALSSVQSCPLVMSSPSFGPQSC